jgi:hypothetical protein
MIFWLSGKHCRELKLFYTFVNLSQNTFKKNNLALEGNGSDRVAACKRMVLTTRLLQGLITLPRTFSLRQHLHQLNRHPGECSTDSHFNFSNTLFQLSKQSGELLLSGGTPSPGSPPWNISPPCLRPNARAICPAVTPGLTNFLVNSLNSSLVLSLAHRAVNWARE